MKQIIGMTREDLLNLDPNAHIVLSAADILYIFNVFDGCWLYDYMAANKKRVGLHAELKSGKCSDGFFYSKTVLQHSNLRRIIAANLVRIYKYSKLEKPAFVAGIPKGASELGDDVAEIMGAKKASLIKDKDGRIRINDAVLANMRPSEKLLLAEDFCSSGTGFIETVLEIKSHYPSVGIIAVELVILNRGGIKTITAGSDSFDVLALVEHKINSWDYPCKLCSMGSGRIKPKATEENWKILINSQR